MLTAFDDVPLLDRYDVYQHLMDYWAATLQDDVYLLVQEGWAAVLDGKPNTDLLPPALVIRRYFAAEQAEIEKYDAVREVAARNLEELDEEHGGEDGLLADAKTDKGKLTAKSVKERQKAIAADPEAAEERAVLQQALKAIEAETILGKLVKDTQKALGAKVAAHYARLSREELRTLVVEDKWLATLAADVQSELDRVSQALTGRIRQLADRYAAPLPQLTAEVDTLTARVAEHLKQMGAQI